MMQRLSRRRLPRAVLLVLCICAARAAADTALLPTDANIEYLGRCDRRAATAPAFDWPATTLRVHCTGTRIAVMLNNTGNSYRFRAFVDGVAVPDVICTTIGSNTYPIVAGLAQGAHCLELVKKNEERVAAGSAGGWCGPRRSRRHLRAPPSVNAGVCHSRRCWP